MQMNIRPVRTILAVWLAAGLIGACTSATGCSSADLPPQTTTRDNLPSAVEETRLSIINAALICDYEGLAAIAGPGFKYGDGEAPLADSWEQGEKDGDQPMRRLVQLLRGSMATVALESVEYRFPSASGFASWDEIPAAARDALANLYTDAEILDFEEAGQYIGIRTAIAADGTWMYFLSGE